MTELLSRGRWKSRLGFIVAASGSAIGLGNIWKFPYITGENGGGAFVLFYLLCICLVGLPMMISEIMVGRMTQKTPVAAFKQLDGAKSPYKYIGWVAIVGAFLLLSFYSVVAGWSLEYLFKSISGAFAGHSASEISDQFGSLYTNPGRNVFWHAIFMIACIAIVLRGVQRGIEKWAKILMGCLFVLIIAMVFRSLTSEGGMAGLEFVFKPDFSKLTPAAMLEALGHAFFTLSLGMATMFTYGSYLGNSEDIVQSSFWISVLDTVIALLACLMIFPVVFAYGFEPAAGPGLVFKTMPIVFSKMPLGMFFSSLFFVLLFFAALTSGISLLEPVVSSAVDSLKWSRRKACWLSGGAIFLVGILSALSGSKLSHIHIFGERNFMDSADYLVSNWLMPLGGLAMTLYVGWHLDQKVRQAEFVKGSNAEKYFKMWNFAVRYVSPAALIIVFLNIIGVFKLFS